MRRGDKKNKAIPSADELEAKSSKDLKREGKYDAGNNGSEQYWIDEESSRSKAEEEKERK